MLKRDNYTQSHKEESNPDVSDVDRTITPGEDHRG